MIRKDYILIAKILKRSVTNKTTPEIEGLIRDFCNILKNDNIKFNSLKFMDYIFGGARYEKY